MDEQTASVPVISWEVEQGPVKRTHFLSSSRILEKNAVMNKINIAENNRFSLSY